MLIPDKGSFNQEKSETETVFQQKFKNKASCQPTEGFGNLIWLDKKRIDFWFRKLEFGQKISQCIFCIALNNPNTAFSVVNRIIHTRVARLQVVVEDDDVAALVNI